jgi:hypothetical protein
MKATEVNWHRVGSLDVEGFNLASGSVTQLRRKFVTLYWWRISIFTFEWHSWQPENSGSEKGVSCFVSNQISISWCRRKSSLISMCWNFLSQSFSEERGRSKNHAPSERFFMNENIFSADKEDGKFRTSFIVNLWNYYSSPRFTFLIKIGFFTTKIFNYFLWASTSLIVQ